MLIRTFLFFIVVLALGLGVDALSQNPGVLELQWYGWKVQTTAAFAVVAMAIVGLLVVMLTSIYIWLIQAPKRLHKHLGLKRQEKGLLAFNDALQALAIGDDAAALKAAKEAHKLLPKLPLADTLMAEVTARQHTNAKPIEVRKQYQKLLAKPHTKVIGLRGLLNQALENGESKQALTYALDFYREKPKNPYVLNILTHLYARQQQVAEAIFYAEKLVGMTPKNSKEQDQAQFVLACLQRLHVQQLALTSQTEEALKTAERATKNHPTFMPLVLQLAHLYDQQGHQTKAIKLLAKAYKHVPSLRVGRTWLGLHKNTKDTVLLKKLEKFTAPWPEVLTSDLLKAEVLIKTRNYTEARSLLESLILKGDDKTLFQTLAELELAQQPNSPQAAKWLQKALTAPDRLQQFDGHTAAFEAWRRALVESPLIHLHGLSTPLSFTTELVPTQEALEHDHA